MFKDFQGIITRASEIEERPWICILKAEDEKNILAAKEAVRLNLARFILIGQQEKIKGLIDDRDPHFQILGTKDDQETLEVAIDLVEKKEVSILMKGLLSSGVLLRGLLAHKNLLQSPLLSHLAAFDVPYYHRVFFMTDGGINVKPDLLEKKEILKNAIKALQKLGFVMPKVALLAATETIEPKIESTIHAALLKGMRERGQIKGALLDGPLALDIAMQKEAAALKGIKGEVAGEADLLLVPNIESGNIMGKTISHLTGGTMAGLVLGAAIPIILTSRSDTYYGRLASIAMAVLEVTHGDED